MTNIDKIHRQVYDSEQTVQIYAKASDLQKAESTIIEILKNQLSGMRMLDIGIGGGRTTVHFAPKVNEYTGIDYSQSMVSACEQRFMNDLSNKKFKQMDVRDMKFFPDHSFDFILFSFNGIDLMPHEDRLKALNEIKRVIKPGGYFCLSSHNFCYLEHYVKVPSCRNPFRWWQMMNRSREIKNTLNAREQVQYAIIHDGGEEFRARMYYIKPTEQLRQLEENGFSGVRVFSEKTGAEIQDQTKLDQYKNDRWLYYLCQRIQSK